MTKSTERSLNTSKIKNPKVNKGARRNPTTQAPKNLQARSSNIRQTTNSSYGQQQAGKSKKRMANKTSSKQRSEYNTTSRGFLPEIFPIASSSGILQGRSIDILLTQVVLSN
jgi:hypothetical protein